MGTMKILGGLKLEQILPSEVFSSIPNGMRPPQTAVEKAASKGDMPVEWDPTSPNEVHYAREIYNHATGKGFQAFANGKKQTSFDPNAGQLTFIPPMAGGAYEHTLDVYYRKLAQLKEAC
jgi:hypothetical protein